MKRFRVIAAVCVLMAVLAVAAAVAVPLSVAAAPAAAWGVVSAAYPSDFSAEDNTRCLAAALVAHDQCDTFVVSARNVGARPTGEKAVTLSDTLPAGLSVRSVSIFWDAPAFGNQDLVSARAAACSEVPAGAGTMVRCSIPITFFASQPEPDRHVLPDGTLKMEVSVTVKEPVTPGVLVNRASVSGGGVAGEASTSSQNTLSEGPAGFGPAVFSAPLTAADGLAETQAGAHPYELSTTFDLNSSTREGPQANQGGSGLERTAVQDLRDIVVDLPVGMAGSGVSAARCTLARLASEGERGEQNHSGCPADTIMGYVRTSPEETDGVISPVYNLIPERGYAAELGFLDGTQGTHVLYVSLAPTPAGYVLRTTTREIPAITLTEILADVYGDPAARTRAQEGVEAGGAYVYGTKPGDVPTFTNPDDCNGAPLVTTVHMDSWQSPGVYNSDGTPDFSDPHWVKSTFESGPPVTGCEALAGLFNPSLTARAESGVADSPTGLDVDLKVPQSEGVEALGTPPVRDTVVTLPEGMTVNPSSANGLATCSEAQIGWQGNTPAAEGQLEDFNAAPPACPGASKVGTLELEAPALPSEACKEATVPLQECPNASEREKTPLLGSIYVAKQNENPFGSLLALYFVVDDPRTGVLVKIPAEVQANPSTGRLTAVLKDTAQFPFSELRTHFFGGDTAALKTPPVCGAYTVASTITPWSAPQSGPPATPSASFEVAQSPSGSACGAQGFSPSFTAGTAGPQAGAFSSFSVTFSREDGEQNLGGASVTMPPGLLGTLRNVTQCPEPQASRGECGPGSLIGEATTAVGAGPSPYWVHGGQVYLTGPYNGGPFGLSLVVPTTAGPYTLTGNAGPGREVVRASIRVNPSTAQITVVSDPLPTILQGIPLDVRAVNVTVNRAGFIFNPTSCDPLVVAGTLSSAQGASANVSSRFQAANCARLAFKPSFKVSTQAKTSKKNGASLTVNVTSGPGQANIGKVSVTLPKQLPARLSTIQQACTEAAFNQNPATCPAGSNIGVATATTPVLANPVRGPAYLVSHGAAAFPDVVLVLQGEGITLDLTGNVDIEKGITSSTFNSVPDAPIDTFQLKLPEGPHSGLTAVLPAKAKGILCGSSLTMPTTITGQNGAVLKQSTKIQVTNCPKAKKAKKKATKHKHKPKRRQQKR